MNIIELNVFVKNNIYLIIIYFLIVINNINITLMPVLLSIYC